MADICWSCEWPLAEDAGGICDPCAQNIADAEEIEYYRSLHDEEGDEE